MGIWKEEGKGDRGGQRRKRGQGGAAGHTGQRDREGVITDEWLGVKLVAKRDTLLLVA